MDLQLVELRVLTKPHGRWAGFRRWLSSLLPKQRRRLHSGESALVKAPPQTSHPDVADVGFAGGQADGMPTDGELIKAAMSGDVEKMRRLIDAGSNMDERDRVSQGGGSVSVGRGGWRCGRGGLGGIEEMGAGGLAAVWLGLQVQRCGELPRKRAEWCLGSRHV